MAKEKTKKSEKPELEEVEEEYPGELESEGFIEDLEDKEQDEVPDIEPAEDESIENLKKDFEKFDSVLEKHQNAITVNQKYLKKILERVKQVEDNFKTLVDKIE
ncbi:hypothetical protein LCGC14_2534770 [marine sediment metagenome]|uniref:Uncharacterized protein n=1 Tax=marine sediment metagenome TaxID=412755 RepID=A0A0F9BFD1_9ZZZZ